jgi:hypothetical protein
LFYKLPPGVLFMLIEFIIASMCSQTPNINYQACLKASEASAYTLGFVKTEKQFTDFATARGKYYLGNTVWTYGAVVGGLGYKAYRDKSITYKFAPKNVIPIDYITPSFNPHGGSLQVEWRW